MFWTRGILGTDLYHIVQWFLIYSMLGWLVESIYMSVCNRKLTNRGFMRGPMCPIYGVGALTVYFLLQPVCHNIFLLYFSGALFDPTLLEYVTAKIMIRIFGEVWWDYSQKPFNYKGILCLESTIAWGFYTLGLFLFLHKGVEYIVSSYSYKTGIWISSVLLLIFSIDFGSACIYRRKTACRNCIGIYQKKNSESVLTLPETAGYPLAEGYPVVFFYICRT